MSSVAMGNGVPAPPVPFVGRDQELATLDRSVTPGRRVALTTGLQFDGTGRTALARAFAARSTAFDSAVWWSLPLDGARPHHALHRWGMRCGVSQEGLVTRDALLATVGPALSRLGRLLVVIDGVSARDVEDALAVLGALPQGCAVLATTDTSAVAEALGLAPVVVEPLREADAVALLEVHARSHVPPIIASTALASAGSLPLGVRLMGARLLASDPDGSTGVWGGSVDSKRVARLGGSPPIARCLLDILGRVPDDLAAAFRGLGALEHGALQPQRLALAMGASEAQAVEWLQGLEGFGLIQALGEFGPWEVHPTLRRHAARLAREAKELDLMQARRRDLLLLTEGRPTEGLGPHDVQDLVDEALGSGDPAVVVPLARVARAALGASCLEPALELVELALSEAGDDPELLAERDALRALRQGADAREHLLDELDEDSALGEEVWIDIAELSGEVGDEAYAATHAVRQGDDEDDDVSVAPTVHEEEFVVDLPAMSTLEVDLIEVDEVTAHRDAPAPLRPSPGRETRAVDDADETQVMQRSQLFAAVAAARARVGSDDVQVTPVGAREQFALLNGLALDETAGSVDDLLEAAEPEGPTQIFDLGRLVGLMGRGRPEASIAGSRDRAAAASAAAVALHARVLQQVHEAALGQAGRTSAAETQAFDALLQAARKLTEHVRVARSAASGGQRASMPAAARRAADRAERAREAAEHANAIVDSAWAALQDARVESVEAEARREAAVHRMRRDIALARQVGEDAVRRLDARRVGAGVPDGHPGWLKVDALLAEVKQRLAEAEQLFEAIGAQSVDLEEGADRVQTLREAIEEASRKAAEEAASAARGLHAEDRRRDLLQEVREQLGRVRENAEWIGMLTDEVQGILGSHRDAEAAELALRAERIRSEALAQTERASACAASLEEASEEAWPELMEGIGTSARRTSAALAEAEALRSDADAWSRSAAEEHDGVMLAELQAEAAMAASSLEATSAVVWRASARARQAALQVEPDESEVRVDALTQAEDALRDAVEEARRAVRVSVDASTWAVARDGWQVAEPLVRAAEKAAERASHLAEEVLQAADARRRALLDEFSALGEVLAAKVQRLRGMVERAMDEASGLVAAFGDAPPAAWGRLGEAAERMQLTRDAAEDGVRRLRRARDTALAERIAQAMGEAAELATTLHGEVDDALAELRSLHEMRFDPAFRLRTALDAAEEAREAIGAARSEVEAVRARASGAIGAVVAHALHEADADLERAEGIAGSFPDTDAADDAEAVAADIEARADAIARLAERVRQGALSASRLLDTVQRRQRGGETAAAPAWDAAETLATARARLGDLPALTEPADDAPAPVHARFVSLRRADDAARGALVALEQLAARGGDPSEAGSLLDRLDTEVDRARRIRQDLELSEASWREHAHGRRADGAAAVAMAAHAVVEAARALEGSESVAAGDLADLIATAEALHGRAEHLVYDTRLDDAALARLDVDLAALTERLRAAHAEGIASSEDADAELHRQRLEASALRIDVAREEATAHVAAIEALVADGGAAFGGALDEARADLSTFEGLDARAAKATPSRVAADDVEAAAQTAERLAAALATQAEELARAVSEAGEALAREARADLSVRAQTVQAKVAALRRRVDEAPRAVEGVRADETVQATVAALLALGPEVQAIDTVQPEWLDPDAHVEDVAGASRHVDAALGRAEEVARRVGALEDALQGAVSASIKAELEEVLSRAQLARDRAAAGMRTADAAAARVVGSAAAGAAEAASAVTPLVTRVRAAADEVDRHAVAAADTASLTQATSALQRAEASLEALDAALADLEPVARAHADAVAAWASMASAERVRSALSHAASVLVPIRVKAAAAARWTQETTAAALLDETAGLVRDLRARAEALPADVDMEGAATELVGVARAAAAALARQGIAARQEALHEARKSRQAHREALAAARQQALDAHAPDGLPERLALWRTAATRWTEGAVTADTRSARREVDAHLDAAWAGLSALQAAWQDALAATEAQEALDAARRAQASAARCADAEVEVRASLGRLAEAVRASQASAHEPEAASASGQACRALRHALAELGAGRVHTARDALEQVAASDADPEVEAMVARVHQLLERASDLPTPTGALAAWVASKEARRRWRRIASGA